MELNRSKIELLKAIVEGSRTRKEIAKATNLSINRCSEILIELEKDGFITRKRINKRLVIEIAYLPYAQQFKELAISSSAFKIEDFLTGIRFRILSCCLLGWKTTKDIAEQLGIALTTVQNNIGMLQDRGLLMVEKRRYKFDRKAWPKVYSFLYAYRTFSSLMIDVLWKFEDEILFEVNEEQQIKGSLTGFSAYGQYGVKIRNVKYYCHLPEKKLGKEEIFIHSLLQIRDDTRSLDLAIVFYIKNKLDNKKLTKLAVIHDLYPVLQDFLYVIQTSKSTTIERIMPKILPIDSRKEIEETLRLYNTKW